MIRKRRGERSGTRFEIVMRGCLPAMLSGIGRLIRAALLICAICVICRPLQAQTLTTVSGTLHGPEGALLSGTITISSNSTFTAADGTVVAKGTVATVQVTSGVFSVSLVPNAGSTPSGTSYRALYNLGRVYLSETWVVPSSASPVDLAAVRTATAPSPAVQFSINQVTPPVGCSGQLTWADNAWSCTQSGFSGTLDPTTQLGPGSGAVNISAGGTNQNINLMPSGSGTVNVTGSATANQFLQLPSANDGTMSSFPNLGTLYIRATPVMDASSSGGWHYNYTGDPWVFEDGGQYYMYFYGATSGGTLAAGYATSDNLLNWTEYGSNPVFNPGSGYDADDVVKPSIVKIGSTYYAYCQVQDGSGVMRIGLFTASSPGGPWTDHGSAVISTGSEPGGYTTDAIEAPVVYHNGSTYYLYYMAQLNVDNRWETFYATSTDGINWTHQGLAIPFGASGSWDQGCIAPGRIVRIGNYYVMAANGCDTLPAGPSLEGNPGGIGIFYSTDLANWTEYSLDPVVPASTYWGPYRANLVNADGTIWMFFNMKGVYWTGARATATAERIYAARFGAPFPDGNMTTDGTDSYVATTLGLGQPPLSPPTGGGTIYHQLYVTNPPGENHGAGIEVYDHGQPTFISSGDPNTGHIWSFSMRTDSTYQLFYNSDGTTGGWHEYFLFDTHGDLISLPVSFSALPACSSSIEGAMRPVTDSTVNTWGATVTGGGSNHVEAYCDGTNWTVAAN